MGSTVALKWLMAARSMTAPPPSTGWQIIDTKELDVIATRSNEQIEQIGLRLTFDGSMTIDFANELEDRIIDAMRQHRRLEVDLSGVREIDLCGVHLIRLLQTVGGKDVDFVATSPVVDHAVNGLGASRSFISLPEMSP